MLIGTTWVRRVSYQEARHQPNRFAYTTPEMARAEQKKATLDLIRRAKASKTSAAELAFLHGKG